MEGRGNVPNEGAVLLIGNHQSYLDIVMMGLACPRRIHFLAKKPLFNNRILAAIMRFFETIPVDASFGRAGLEGILHDLKKGRAVLIYPEGERSWNENLAPLKPGVSLLVKKAQCPIVPVGIAGAFEAWPRTRGFMRFAPPFLNWSKGRIAVSVGNPIDGAELAKLDREGMLAVLAKSLQTAIDRADRLRGNRDSTRLEKSTEDIHASQVSPSKNGQLNASEMHRASSTASH
jgi:1-acyl-sn-glycerol-3-phosphate acyltransferase